MRQPLRKGCPLSAGGYEEISSVHSSSLNFKLQATRARDSGRSELVMWRDSGASVNQISRRSSLRFARDERLRAVSSFRSLRSLQEDNYARAVWLRLTSWQKKKQRTDCAPYVLFATSLVVSGRLAPARNPKKRSAVDGQNTKRKTPDREVDELISREQPAASQIDAKKRLVSNTKLHTSACLAEDQIQEQSRLHAWASHLVPRRSSKKK